MGHPGILRMTTSRRNARSFAPLRMTTRCNNKSRLIGGFFFFHSISSEYQVQTDLLPGFRRYFGVEVVLYQTLLLSSEGEGA
jgi:hypothetical protein